MPPYRTQDYAIWRACERFHVTPPGTESRWDDMTFWGQTLLLAYNQIREYEESDDRRVMLETIARVPPQL